VTGWGDPLATYNDLTWASTIERDLKQMYADAVTANMYSNLVDEDSEYASKIIKRIKNLNQISKLDPVSLPP
jgi:hypothetical protein